MTNLYFYFWVIFHYSNFQTYYLHQNSTNLAIQQLKPLKVPYSIISKCSISFVSILKVNYSRNLKNIGGPLVLCLKCYGLIQDFFGYFDYCFEVLMKVFILEFRAGSIFCHTLLLGLVDCHLKIEIIHFYLFSGKFLKLQKHPMELIVIEALGLQKLNNLYFIILPIQKCLVIMEYYSTY